MNYTMYYKPDFKFISQYGDEFTFGGLEYYHFFSLKASIYSPAKTKIPAVSIYFVLFGLGFSFHTHYRK